MVVEVGLTVYVWVALVALAVGRVPAAAARAAAAGVVVGVVGWTTGGGEWWPAWYAGGLVGWGAPYHDVQVISLICLGVAVAALGGLGCAGWNAHEYTALVVVLVVAALTTLAADHLAVLYLTLELQALTAYTLVGYYRTRVLTTESALKYLLVGSAVSGFMLVGLFQVYVGSGSFGVGDLALSRGDGAAWVVATVLFKVGAAPFHFWAPSVYESVEWPTLVALVSFAKLNVWVLLFGVLHPVVEHGWWPAALAGVASLVTGAIGGLYQTSLGGVLGYSAVLNSGYLLTIAATGPTGGVQFGLMLYVLAYSVGAAALAGVVAVGFGHRPLTRGVTTTASALGVYYLTLHLGGLPVYPGFATKLYLLWVAAPAGLTLGVVVVGSSVFAVLYYLQASSFFVLDDAEPALAEPNPRPIGTGVGVWVGGVVVAPFVAALVATPPM